MSSVWDIEVALRTNVSNSEEDIKTAVTNILRSSNGYSGTFSSENSGCILKNFSDPYLKSCVEFVKICDQDEEIVQPKGLFEKANLNFYFYTLRHSRIPVSLEVEDTEVSAATQFHLPDEDFEGLWETLILEPGLKSHLLNFVSSVMLFSNSQVNTNIVSCNGIILFHGPPGTGKTTLCKGLAQKLAIRLNHLYASTYFFEVNTHCLFSKWFSQSAKVVSELFTILRHIINQKNVFVCLLLDEVESLTHTRRPDAAEPSDAIRVVNAVLTNLDELRRFPNVLILATSNITGAIDGAFLDRADIKQFIGPPTASAIYQIYFECLEELKRVGHLTGSEFPVSYHTLKHTGFFSEENQLHDVINGSEKGKNTSYTLMNIARKSVGLSGRTLRKIPTLTYSRCYNPRSVDIETYLQAMEIEVTYQKEKETSIKTS